MDNAEFCDRLKRLAVGYEDQSDVDQDLVWDFVRWVHKVLEQGLTS